MKKLKPILTVVFLLVLLIAALNSTFIVDESNQAIITQFGRPVGDPINDPGVHFKIPFIQDIQYFDKRFLEWDGDPNQVPTKDKKFIFVDSFARWRITDPLQFFRRLRDERGAQSRLDDILDGETRNAIASHDLVEIVRNTNRTPEVDTLITDSNENLLETISIGRDQIQELILRNANARAADLGIEILDVRLKSINYVEDVQLRVYERMVSERNRIAEMFRSEGQGQAFRIAGEKERELLSIYSEAERTSQEIRGRADAEAASIYASAYNKSAQSRDLYDFMKTMETYVNTFDDQTTIILSTKSEFYRYLMSSSGNR
jgi:membrane protease subunit HflC